MLVKSSNEYLYQYTLLVGVKWQLIATWAFSPPIEEVNLPNTISQVFPSQNVVSLLFFDNVVGKCQSLQHQNNQKAVEGF